MIKKIFLLLCFSNICFCMEDQNNGGFFNYVTDILPHMPSYTNITPEKGAAVLSRLREVNFDKEQPEWKFEHAFDWARDNHQKLGKQVDLAILKRFVAMHIDRSEKAALNSIKESIIKDPDSLRWVVISDVCSAVSDVRIKERWDQFIGELILDAPIGQLLRKE